jgi:hypothetical protein
VTEIYRGQQGHPTPDERAAGPVEAIDAETASAPLDVDWRQPEDAEATLEETRASLQQSDPSEGRG